MIVIEYCEVLDLCFLIYLEEDYISQECEDMIDLLAKNSVEDVSYYLGMNG